MPKCLRVPRRNIATRAANNLMISFRSYKEITNSKKKLSPELADIDK